jgi:hypothetical protein
MEKHIGYYVLRNSDDGLKYAVLGSCRYKDKSQRWNKGIIYLKNSEFCCIPLKEFENKFEKATRGKYG